MWSEVVRQPGFCVRCGSTRGPFEAAHIIRRARQGTRCDPMNGWCLCHRCHGIVDADGNRNAEYWELVTRPIGQHGFDLLVVQADAAEGQRILPHEWEAIADGLADRLR